MTLSLSSKYIIIIAVCAGGTVSLVLTMALIHILLRRRRARLAKKAQQANEVAAAIRRSRASLGTLPYVGINADVLPDTECASLVVHISGSPRSDEQKGVEDKIHRPQTVVSQGHDMLELSAHEGTREGVSISPRLSGVVQGLRVGPTQVYDPVLKRTFYYD
jgi:hypothetical protein